MAGTDIAEYGVKFINTETLEEVQAKVKNGMYKVSLTPGYTYTAVLQKMWDLVSQMRVKILQCRIQM